MTDQHYRRYGFVGWKELLRTRKNLLDEFDKARELNASRPVQTEHGNVGEASVRAWLSSFLPSRYGVTSGYIIPGIITEKYKLLSYDAIIYDSINAPTLWVDSNPDHSEQGRKRAIPAENVRAVFEVKSKLNHRGVAEAMGKLGELNAVHRQLPKEFHSEIIFFEFDSTLNKRVDILQALIPYEEIVGYSGGLVLRCDINPGMTGYIQLLKPDGTDGASLKPDEFLAKDVDDVQMWRRPDGGINLPDGASVFIYADGNKLHVSKQYICSAAKDPDRGVMIAWSFNNFAKFMVDLLLRLEGKTPASFGGAVFGQVFDILDVRTD